MKRGAYGAWSVKCEGWSGEWRVESVKCGVESVKRGDCEVWSVKCAV